MVFALSARQLTGLDDSHLAVPVLAVEGNRLHDERDFALPEELEHALVDRAGDHACPEHRDSLLLLGCFGFGL